jgi:group I intron endonuclease
MIIYEIKNKINGKVYIGQHSSNELGTYWGSGKLIKRAIEKYGLENFERFILEKCSTKEELNEREKYWIIEKDSINFGYNLTEGGTGGDNSKFIDYSEEWKEIQRNNAKQYWKTLSTEKLKERSDKVSGENNGMFGEVGYWKGKKISKEAILKQLKSRRSYGGEGNPNWKGGTSFKYCECGIKIAPTNNTCKNCRDISGENNPFFGKQHSEETKKKLSEIRKGKKPTNMKQVIIDDIIYESLAEASRQTGVPSPTILWRINSKNKKYENYLSN